MQMMFSASNGVDVIVTGSVGVGSDVFGISDGDEDMLVPFLSMFVGWGFVIRKIVFAS